MLIQRAPICSRSVSNNDVKGAEDLFSQVSPVLHRVLLHVSRNDHFSLAFFVETVTNYPIQNLPLGTLLEPPMYSDGSGTLRSLDHNRFVQGFSSLGIEAIIRICFSRCTDPIPPAATRRCFDTASCGHYHAERLQLRPRVRRFIGQNCEHLPATRFCGLHCEKHRCRSCPEHGANIPIWELYVRVLKLDGRWF